MVSSTRVSNALISVRSIYDTSVFVVALVAISKAEVLTANVAIKVVLKFIAFLL